MLLALTATVLAANPRQGRRASRIPSTLIRITPCFGLAIKVFACFSTEDAKAARDARGCGTKTPVKDTVKYSTVKRRDNPRIQLVRISPPTVTAYMGTGTT